MVTMYAYELFNMIQISSSYIWMDSRLKGLSIESKNFQNGVRMKKLDHLKLEASHEQWLRATRRAYYFLWFMDLI